jgi:hypothetical protein
MTRAPTGRAQQPSRGLFIQWRSKDDEEGRGSRTCATSFLAGVRPHDASTWTPPFTRCARVRAALPARRASRALRPARAPAAAAPRAAPDGLHLLLAAGAAGQRQLHYFAATLRPTMP